MENISGITKIELIPAEYVAAIYLSPGVSLVNSIDFTDGQSFKPFYFTPQSASLDIASRRTDPGTLFVCTLKARAPKDRPEATTFIRANDGCWFLLRVTDGNGIARLIGTPDFPAQFLAKIAIPEKPGDFNGYEFTFTSQQTTPPVYFELN